MFQTEISLFKSATSTDPTTVALGDFLRDTAHRDKILHLRTLDKPERDEVKKTLPAATISGTFSKRSIKGLLAYNGLICMDFDEADNPGKTPDEMKKILAEFDEVAFVGLSVGGRGVFCIIPTNNKDAARHGRMCDFLRTCILQEGLLADPSCKDVSRLRFVSYDPNPVFKPTAVPFDAVAYLRVLDEQQRQRARSSQQDAATPSDKLRYKVEKYLDAIEGGCNDVTHDYREWTRLGFALANEFGAAGESYYHRASQFHPKYSYEATAKKYQELLRNGGNSVGIGTFFYICHQNGIKP